MQQRQIHYIAYMYIVEMEHLTITMVHGNIFTTSKSYLTNYSDWLRFDRVIIKFLWTMVFKVLVKFWYLLPDYFQCAMKQTYTDKSSILYIHVIEELSVCVCVCTSVYVSVWPE